MAEIAFNNMELTVYFTSNGTNRYRVHDNVRVGRKVYLNVSEATLLSLGFHHVVREYVPQEVLDQSTDGWKEYPEYGQCWVEYKLAVTEPEGE